MNVTIPAADDDEEEEEIMDGYPWDGADGTATSKRAEKGKLEATTNKSKRDEEHQPKKARPSKASLAKWKQPDTLRVGKGHTQNQVLAER